jgi:hypothetical protein
VGQVEDGTTTGIPWLTDPQRAFLAHLTTLCIQRQLPKERSYREVVEALQEIDDAGDIVLRADYENVWVLIAGETIVHAERDWLEWASTKWNTAQSN